MARLDAEWELQVQLCRNLENWDSAQLCEIDQETRFNIWTGLAAHQPLGNINRARNETCRHSADYRARVNGCPYHEPTDASA